jgi:NAD(P)H-hydrate epimerase
MAKLVTVSQMIEIEKAADAAGHSYADMMRAAGRSLAEAVLAYSQLEDGQVLALVGTGNNGGDALVALADLAEAGWAVAAYLVGQRDAEDPLVARMGELVSIFRLNEDDDYQALNDLIAECDVLLDGLLGTGVRLPLREPLPELLLEVADVLENFDDPPLVIAVDCPSGLNCETGELAPESLAADVTVTMAAVKAGMLTVPAFELLGELAVAAIGLPEDLPEWVAIRRQVVDEELVFDALPERPADGHKGRFGTALIVAGSANYLGAPLLAGRAAYRVGTGLVSMAVPRGIQAAIAGQLPEATWLPLPEEEGSIGAKVADLSAGLERATAMLIGPGLGTHKASGQFLTDLLATDLPSLVIDADGLRLLAEMPAWPDRLPADTILTPHPGEMAILTGLDKDAIQVDRIGVAERYAQEWACVVVFKGAFTVVADPHGQSAVIPAASSALATAGTGDVLAGMLVGLRAQGVAAFEAACAGAWLHAQAAELAVDFIGGEAGVMAGDLIDLLPELIG